MKTTKELKKMSVNKLEAYLKTLKYCTYILVSKTHECDIEYHGFEFDAITNKFSVKFKHPNDSIYDEDNVNNINTIYGSGDFYYGLFENSNELFNAVNYRLKDEKQKTIAELEKRLAELKSQI
jgi:ribosomal protein L29